MKTIGLDFKYIQYGMMKRKCSWCDGKTEPGTTRTSNLHKLVLCYHCENLYEKFKESISKLEKEYITKARKNARRRNIPL